jgi:hypothetical protein
MAEMVEQTLQKSTTMTKDARTLYIEQLRAEAAGVYSLARTALGSRLVRNQGGNPQDDLLRTTVVADTVSPLFSVSPSA